MASVIIFYCLAAMIIGFALLVVSLRNTMHCALSLMVTLLGVAGIFILLGADFLAAIQVMIYVGGIMVLLIFVVMLTQKVYDRSLSQTNEQGGIAFVAAAILVGVAVYAIAQQGFAQFPAGEMKETTASLGKLLMTRYVLPFEVASVLLLAAMVGAIVFTKKE